MLLLVIVRLEHHRPIDVLPLGKEADGLVDPDHLVRHRLDQYGLAQLALVRHPVIVQLEGK